MDSALIESNDVNVLSVWHIVGINGELISTGKCSCFYIDMKNYVATLNSPKTVVKENKHVLVFDVSDIKTFVEKKLQE